MADFKHSKLMCASIVALAMFLPGVAHAGKEPAVAMAQPQKDTSDDGKPQRKGKKKAATTQQARADIPSDISANKDAEPLKAGKSATTPDAGNQNNTQIAQAATGAPSGGAKTTKSQGTVVQSDTALESVVVTGAKAGITNIRPTDTVSGLQQEEVEIPRSVTTLDSTLLKDIQVRSIHDLTAAAPSTYTAAYFGVAGAVQIRGNIADNYYRGFKGINNLGYYETPTESVSNIEIVRGPVSPMYDSSKIGGMLNLTPKTDVAETLKESGSGPTALATFTLGSFGEHKGTIEGGVPISVDGNNAAIYAYLYVNKSDSYYRDFHPNDQEGQLGYSMDLGPDWQLNLGTRLLVQQGHLASPGWNRLTQQLIDNGSYLAGAPAVSLVNSNPNTLLPADLQPFQSQLRQTINPLLGNFGHPTNVDAIANPHLVTLSPRNLNTSPFDFNNNLVSTNYADLIYSFANGDQVKLQGFNEYLENDMFSAAGNSTRARGDVYEGRLSYIFQRDFTDWLKAQTITGASYRYYHVSDFANYARGYVIYDRNDLSAKPTADMVLNDQYLNPTGNVWDFAYYSDIGTVGLFFNTDATLFDNLHIQGGARWEDYNIDSINRGVTSFGGSLNTWYNSKTSPLDYQISVNYETPWGVIPYFTFAKTKSLEGNKGGSIDPSLMIGKKYLSPSELAEAGLKSTLLDGQLYATFDFYSMHRNQRDALSGAINQTHSQGVEAELRWAVTPNFDILANGSVQKTNSFGGTTIAVSAPELGYPGQSIYAGEFLVSTANVPGLQNGYEDTTLPRDVGSIFGTYTFNFEDDSYLKVSGGVTVASEAHGYLANAVVAPSYAVARTSLSYTIDRYTFDFQVENLNDARYFYLGQPAYSEVAALPAIGRSFHLRAAARF
jgi:iron complex outermembrane receptor protein